MADLEMRVANLEKGQAVQAERQTALEKQQGRMWKKLESMDEHLKAIQKTLNKLFYTGIGFALMYLFQTIGVAEVLKKMIL